MSESRAPSDEMKRLLSGENEPKFAPNGVPLPTGVRVATSRIVICDGPGIPRPTDIRVTLGGEGIPAKVVVVEPTGAETELLVRVGGKDLVVVMHGRTTAQPDDTVMLGVAQDKTHVFDADGGQRLDTIDATVQ